VKAEIVERVYVGFGRSQLHAILNGAIASLKDPIS